MKNISIYILVFYSILIAITACKNDSNSSTADKNIDKLDTKADSISNLKITISSPSNEKNYVIGDKISISVGVKNQNPDDSIVLLVNNKKNIILKKDFTYIWETKSEKVGTNTVDVHYKSSKVNERQQKKIILYSDIKPKEYGYKIKNTYKHDVLAYTQGLFWYNGFLYEATGLEGESTVRKVKLETGDVVQSFAIPSDVFGEGIVLSDNRIIQITWQSGRGFVYDINTFKQIGEFSYAGEGWGITSDGEKLFMTNGTNQVHVLEKQSFSIIDELEVYDDKGPVKYLNELEYINGEIYANIYRYEKIVRIDPKTGKVLAYIDLGHILPMSDYTTQTDVLNGIAYDAAKKRLFVTGKLWPKLFEIELTEK
jgi:glutamine cyclotransferase